MVESRLLVCQTENKSTRFILLHQTVVLLAVMWRQNCNKPSAKILDKMTVFENCEGRQAMKSGKFQTDEERCRVCDIEVPTVYTSSRRTVVTLKLNKIAEVSRVNMKA